MDSNDCLKQIHRALIAKAKVQCTVAGNNKLAAEIGGKIGAYGAYWGTAFGDDGTLSDDEGEVLCQKFDAILDAYVPKKDGMIVEKAWNGFSIFFVNVFKGVKNYLNEWFNLGLE